MSLNASSGSDGREGADSAMAVSWEVTDELRCSVVLKYNLLYNYCLLSASAG